MAETDSDPEATGDLPYDDYAKSEEGYSIEEYDLTSTPNDFNVKTIFDFIESGAVLIPEFQRNYIWDKKRASRLIESLIMGLPVPQVFLYEEERNKFLVIDGQQRLLTIYYFIKGRFPRHEKRSELRAIFDEKGKIPPDVLANDLFFQPFKLALSSPDGARKSRFDGLNYETLGESQIQFNLRPIRNVIVKQASPKDDDSSIYEIFNRLNTGGVNLTAQEIRASLYHSPFFRALSQWNMKPRWRALIGLPSPDRHAKDVEILLRCIALLVDGENYAPSMTRFLNSFCRKGRAFDSKRTEQLAAFFDAFLEATKNLPTGAFHPNKRLNVALLEAVFVASTAPAYRAGKPAIPPLRPERVATLSEDHVFLTASQAGTTRKSNVQARLTRARELLEL